MAIILNPTEFSGPTEKHSFDGFLFDLDGTIVDSTPAIIEHWKNLGETLGVSTEEILRTAHGRRCIDVIRHFNPDKATWEYVASLEGRLPIMFADQTAPIPGSVPLVETLSAANIPWAIVTSGTRVLATGWLKNLGLAAPQHFVTAEDVKIGKPDPEGYAKGATLLFSDAYADEGKRLVVFEDAPAGVKAGKAAGHFVVAVSTTHEPADLAAAGADWVVEDSRSVVAHVENGTVVLEISKTWRGEDSSEEESFKA